MGTKPECEGALFAIGLLVLAGMYGCLPMAVPPALSLARAAISGISSAGHEARNNQAAQNTEPCNLGGRPLPQLIEIQTDQSGKTMYRTLKPGESQIGPQTQETIGQIGGLGEWRAIGDFSGVDFQPSLQSQLVPSSTIFLAYAPARVRDAAEESQFDALNHDFRPIGTFDSDNRVFLYALVHQLPCESPQLPKSTQATNTSPRPESPEQPEQPMPSRSFP